jgi:hypothetical protein
MAEPRRSGCGCLLTGLLLLILGPLLVGLLVVPVREGQFRPALAVFAAVLVGGMVAVALRGRSSPTMSGPEGDVGDDGSGRRGVPTSPISDDPPIPPGVIAPPPPPTRPVRRTSTSSAPLDPEVAMLKDRLAEAVADLNEEGTTRPIYRGVTSDEMIARAKQRIREWTDD